MTIEKMYEFNESEEKLVEKIVNDDNVHINHIILGKGQAMPEHFSNSNVYLIVVKGQMSLKLADQDAAEYSQGKIINIPYKTKMLIKNENSQLMEFFVVKAPNPSNFEK